MDATKSRGLEGSRLPSKRERPKERERESLVEQIGTNDRRKAVKASLYTRFSRRAPWRRSNRDDQPR